MPFAIHAQCIPDKQDSINYSKVIGLNDFNETQSAFSAYLEHLQLTIEYLIREDEDILKTIDTKEDQFKDRIEQSCDDPYQTFYLAELKLRNAFIQAKTGNELTATWQIRQAYKMLDKNITEYPEFIPQYKTMGLLHILLGSVPEKHQWIIELLGMTGDIEAGLKELNRTSEQSGLFQLEAQIIRLIIDAFLLNNSQEASKQILEVYKKQPQNELIAYLTITILLKANDSQTAKTILEDTEISKNPLLYYQSGETFLQSGDYNLAEVSYLKFLQNFKGENFIKDTYYKLFLTKWLSNNKNKALEYYNLAQNMGQSLIEADKHAHDQLKSEKLPDPTIMKIRLFTDGGMYEAADSIARDASIDDFESYSEQTEFLYRKARLFHKQNKLKAAQSQYRRVLERTYNNEYFIPNSSLQLGYLYLKQNEKKQAKEYFDKTLTFKDYNYESSIRNKAKSALKLID